MTTEQRIQNLSVPAHPVDAVLDTDAYNEIDDQFAICYLLKNSDKLRTKAIYAAPFKNERSESAADGMEKSYGEIQKLLLLAGESREVYRGAERFLPDEKTPVPSAAASDLVKRAKGYTPEDPLYVVAIGAITNVASALLTEPSIAENIVVVWLGSNALHYHDTREFNLIQDIAAARVVFASGAPLVMLPCMGVVSAFTVSRAELVEWFVGKNPLATYLAENAIAAADSYAAGKPWTRVIWDVTAVAWLLNDRNCFMLSRIEKTPLPTYDHTYDCTQALPECRYVYHIHRDRLLADLVEKICGE